MPADQQRAAPHKQGAAPYARPHTCPHCAAAFGKPSDLTRHVRSVHEKRRDNVCPHCAAAFGQASDLTKHVRTVHEKRRDFVCPHCAAAFFNERTSVAPVSYTHLTLPTIYSV